MNIPSAGSPAHAEDVKRNRKSSSKRSKAVLNAKDYISTRSRILSFMKPSGIKKNDIRERLSRYGRVFSRTAVTMPNGHDLKSAQDGCAIRENRKDEKRGRIFDGAFQKGKAELKVK